VKRFVLPLLLLGVPAMAAEAPEWKIDPKASSIGFAARQMNVPINGLFEVYAGTIRFDPANLEGSKIAMEIRPASASTKQKDVDEQLKLPDWFDAAKHPVARYEAEKFIAKGGDRYEALGQLSLRGVTKELPLPFTLKIAETGDGFRAEAKGETELKRLDFGVGSGQWKATDVVANEVKVTVSITALRPK
jgi:polyisoprenoid-binding protein YceI